MAEAEQASLLQPNLDVQQVASLLVHLICCAYSVQHQSSLQALPVIMEQAPNSGVLRI